MHVFVLSNEDWQKNILENDMDLDDDVLYNFIDATSQSMGDDDATPWRGPREKHSLFFQVLLDALSKPKGIVVDLTTSIGINPFDFTSIFVLI